MSADGWVLVAFILMGAAVCVGAWLVASGRWRQSFDQPYDGPGIEPEAVPDIDWEVSRDGEGASEPVTIHSTDREQAHGGHEATDR